jgi:hypothetical protein
MRRPLDWIVVSISLMVLLANRMLAPKPIELLAPAQEFRAAVAGSPAMAQTDNPFAYIREDGSLQFVPVAATPRLAGKPVKATRTRASIPSTALYTWSSPTIVVDKEAPSFK